jgi:hypothetical protein
MATEFKFHQGLGVGSRAGNANGAAAAAPARSVVSIDEALQRKSMTQKPIHCGSEHCGSPAVCSVDSHFFCVGHFIAHCYERLEQCNKVPAGDTGDEIANSVDRFLQESSRQAATLVDPIRGLDNLERARLFDIFLWASELAAKRGVFTKPEVIDAGYRINRR